MSESTQQILDSIPALVDKADIAALAALRDHSNKQVRKAVRRGEHKLSTKGIKLSDSATKTWSPSGDDALRGKLESSGHVDVRTHAGFTHLWWVSADAESGGAVDMIVVSGQDRVMDYATYGQTDSQRNRLLAQWGKVHADRRVPSDWVLARIRWARKQTIAQGFPVPPTLDRALVRIGSGDDSQRPTNFLLGQIPDASPKDLEMPTLQLLGLAGVPAWPVVVEAEALSSVISDASGILRPEGDGGSDAADQPEESAINDSLKSALASNHSLRGGLSSSVANLLEDAAVSHWLAGSDGPARRLLDLSEALRSEKEPENCAGVVELVRLQLASAARSDTAARARAEQQQSTPAPA